MSQTAVTGSAAAKRICYFCPDYPQPSGGVKTLYRHVLRLREAGLDAVVVHQKHGFRLDWHIYRSPVIWLEDRPQFGAEDVLVFPEVMADMIRQTAGFAGERVVISLSWQPSYARLRPGERWQDHGIRQVLTTSPTIQRHLAWSMEIDATLIPAFVDPTLYTASAGEKSRCISYLTRKDDTGGWLHGALTRRGVAPDDYAWTPLRNLDEKAYAQALRESSFFVTTTLQEGLHVSILEAMACGCVVVGYDGVGGADHMVGEGAGQNCLLAENGNLLALGRTLEHALCEHTRDANVYDKLVAEGIRTASRYQDAASEREALVAFFTGL